MKMDKYLFLLIISLFSMLSVLNAQNPCGTVTDYDGNTYKTVQIGSQCWMAEDLRVTHYEDGTSIPFSDKKSNTEAYWTYHGYDVYVYNWAAVMHGAKSSSKNPSGVQGICPKGWHVPSDEEWTQLFFYVYEQDKYKSGDNSIAKALSEKWSWDTSSEPRTPGNNQRTNNATGFSAISLDGEYAFFHCSTMEDYDYVTAGFWIYYANPEPNPESGLFWPISEFGSVRCLRNEKMSNKIEPTMLFDINPAETQETSVTPQDRKDNTTENSDEEDVVYMFAKEYPEFPGGMDALQNFLRNEIKYPKTAEEKHIKGTVLVEFVIEKDGRVGNARVKVPLSPDCDAEAVRAVMAMPKWKPGKNEGKNVRCFYQIPITFSM